MILGVESSCDESALALLDPKRGLVGEWISSQVSLHAEYGGVVPDLASREHLNNFGPLLREAALEVGFDGVSEIAVTVGPGLAGCLAMGLAVANALGAAWKVPVHGINHLKAHAHSVFIPLYQESCDAFEARMKTLLPHLSLVVSGGNTLLAEIGEDRSLRLLGGTVDDAAGEALDKGAKLLGLGYPGGPKLEAMARGGNAEAYDFPRAMASKEHLDFSFSGLKTSLRYQLDKMDTADIAARMPDLCASYQQAAVDAVLRKADQALKRGGYRSVGLSGGVSNNQLLRDRMQALAKRRRVDCLLAERRHTGDNAGMIAFSLLFDPAARNGAALDIRPSLPIDG